MVSVHKLVTLYIELINRIDKTFCKTFNHYKLSFSFHAWRKSYRKI